MAEEPRPEIKEQNFPQSEEAKLSAEEIDKQIEEWEQAVSEFEEGQVSEEQRQKLGELQVEVEGKQNELLKNASLEGGRVLFDRLTELHQKVEGLTKSEDEAQAGSQLEKQPAEQQPTNQPSTEQLPTDEEQIEQFRIMRGDDAAKLNQVAKLFDKYQLQAGGSVTWEQANNEFEVGKIADDEYDFHLRGEKVSNGAHFRKQDDSQWLMTSNFDPESGEPFTTDQNSEIPHQLLTWVMVDELKEALELKSREINVGNEINTLEPDALADKLQEIKGIGPKTKKYISDGILDLRDLGITIGSEADLLMVRYVGPKLSAKIAAHFGLERIVSMEPAYTLQDQINDNRYLEEETGESQTEEGSNPQVGEGQDSPEEVDQEEVPSTQEDLQDNAQPIESLPGAVTDEVVASVEGDGSSIVRPEEEPSEVNDQQNPTIETGAGTDGTGETGQTEAGPESSTPERGRRVVSRANALIASIRGAVARTGKWKIFPDAGDYNLLPKNPDQYQLDPRENPDLDLKPAKGEDAENLELNGQDNLEDFELLSGEIKPEFLLREAQEQISNSRLSAKQKELLGTLLAGAAGLTIGEAVRALAGQDTATALRMSVLLMVANPALIVPIEHAAISMDKSKLASLKTIGRLLLKGVDWISKPSNRTAFIVGILGGTLFAMGDSPDNPVDQLSTNSEPNMTDESGIISPSSVDVDNMAGEVNQGSSVKLTGDESSPVQSDVDVGTANPPADSKGFWGKINNFFGNKPESPESPKSAVDALERAGKLPKSPIDQPNISSPSPSSGEGSIPTPDEQQVGGGVSGATAADVLRENGQVPNPPSDGPNLSPNLPSSEAPLEASKGIDTDSPIFPEAEAVGGEGDATTAGTEPRNLDTPDTNSESILGNTTGVNPEVTNPLIGYTEVPENSNLWKMIEQVNPDGATDDMVNVVKNAVRSLNNGADMGSLQPGDKLVHISQQFLTEGRSPAEFGARYWTLSKQDIINLMEAVNNASSGNTVPEEVKSIIVELGRGDQHLSPEKLQLLLKFIHKQ